MGYRMAFAVWSSRRSGLVHLTHFSAAHDITGGQAWVTALLLMASGEVVVRIGLIVARGQLLASSHGGPVCWPGRRPLGRTSTPDRRTPERQ